MISGLDPLMHWNILAVLSFEMFLSRGFNENHMFLPLALIPVTHEICYSENFQELSTDPSCPGSKDEFGDNWSLSPKSTGILWTKERAERGSQYRHHIEKVPRKTTSRWKSEQRVSKPMNTDLSAL